MPPTPFWAKPKFVLSIIFVYLAVHFAIRLVLWPTLAADDSEQALFAQHFAWSYRFSAPPLFTWLLVGLGQFIPVGVVSISLLRYALLGVTFVFAYLSARRLDCRSAPRRAFRLQLRGDRYLCPGEPSRADARDRRRRLRVVSPGTSSSGCARSRGSAGIWRSARRSGSACSRNGTSSILAVALPLACLLRRDFRHLVLTWKVVPSAVLAAALVLPTVDRRPASRAAWLATISSRSFRTSDGRSLQQIVKGTLRLANVAIAYPCRFSRSCCCSWAFRCGGPARTTRLASLPAPPGCRLRRRDDRHRTGADMGDGPAPRRHRFRDPLHLSRAS